MKPGNSEFFYRRLAGAVVLLALTLILAAGCSVGPSYKTPPLTNAVTPAFGNGGLTNYNTNETAVTWWRGFNDNELNRLVDLTLATNYDLQVATANLYEARALRNETRFDYLPAPNGTASYNHTRFSQSAEPGVPGNLRNIKLYDVGFDATWEVDIFGRVRRADQAATAEWQAASDHRRDVMVSLISEVARNYFELIGSQRELAVARQNADNQRETLKITEAVSEGGRGTELDVARASAQLNNTLAAIPPLETAVAQAMHRLSVLASLPPTGLVAELQGVKPTAELPAAIAISNPDTLLRRRSDVRNVERSLAAASARIGVATADLFPRVTFNGQISLESYTISGLPHDGSTAYSFGPSITWAALDYGHVRSRIKAADARAEAAFATYERTVLAVLEETENSLVAYGREQTRRDFLLESAKASETAAVLARQRYESGTSDFLTVLDAERVMYEAQDQLAQSNTRTFTTLVAVYKALGGGWENDTAKPVEPPLPPH